MASLRDPATTLGLAPTAPDDDGQPLPDAALAACWEAVIAGVNARKRMLGAFLEESRFVGVVDQGIVLAMDDLHRAVVVEPENRALIASEVVRAFGRPLAVQCALPAGGEARRPAAVPNVSPLIERAIAWFEGDVIETTGRTTTERAH